MNFFLFTTMSTDQDGFTSIEETYIVRSERTVDEVEETFRNLFRVWMREEKAKGKHLDMFQCRVLKELPFFINERAIPCDNFWPLSFAGDK